MGKKEFIPHILKIMEKEFNTELTEGDDESMFFQVRNIFYDKVSHILQGISKTKSGGISK
jgi:elongation factor P hydroxylase